MTHPDDNVEVSLCPLGAQARSARRRLQEQERLSLRSTLNRLTEANTSYDVSKFEAHLPAHFSGYLIRSRRRLEMEGHRQRSSLDACHHKIMTGDCALAAVFVGGQRWTVEMVITGRKEWPIRIVQISSRFDQLPCPAIRNLIHEQLGIPVRTRRTKMSGRFELRSGFPPPWEMD